MAEQEPAKPTGEQGPVAEQPKPRRPAEPFPALVNEALQRRGPATPERIARLNQLYSVALAYTLADESLSLVNAIATAHQIAEYALAYAEYREASAGFAAVPDGLRRG